MATPSRENGGSLEGVASPLKGVFGSFFPRCALSGIYVELEKTCVQSGVATTPVLFHTVSCRVLHPLLQGTPSPRRRSCGAATLFLNLSDTIS